MIQNCDMYNWRKSPIFLLDGREVQKNEDNTWQERLLPWDGPGLLHPMIFENKYGTLPLKGDIGIPVRDQGLWQD